MGADHARDVMVWVLEFWREIIKVRPEKNLMNIRVAVFGLKSGFKSEDFRSCAWGVIAGAPAGSLWGRTRCLMLGARFTA